MQKQKGSSSSRSHFSKESFGNGSTPDRAEAETMARLALLESKVPGKLMSAADLMEEAFNKSPSLREKYASRLQLWRRGISM